MIYRHSRARGGHLIHARQPGNPAALCGFEAGAHDKVHRQMAVRSGWRDYSTDRKITCRKCKAAMPPAVVPEKSA